jgi:hypothetical protein
LWSPWPAAWPSSQPKQALPWLMVPPPPQVKSMARPFSCIDVPGRAVGGEHADDGAW